MDTKIRLSKSTIGAEEKEAVLRVLDGEYLGMGDEVRRFEMELQEALQTRREVMCVNTGTAALHLAVLCLKLQPGDEVLVPTITYVASFQAISASGAKPVACDVREDTLFIDVSDAKKRLTKNTKAIMPVHYASDSQYMQSVYDFAAENGLHVIEDAAHSFGCTRNGKFVGNSGGIICFSFDGIKNITSGEGGAILADDEEFIQSVKDARLLGVEKDTEKRYTGQRSWEFDVKQQGFRYHMSNIMAAIGRAQLCKLDRITSFRQQLAQGYVSSLKDVEGIGLLPIDYSAVVPHIFVVRVKGRKRDGLREYLLSSNIECGIHYQPNHTLSKFRTDYSLPVAEHAYSEILSLPLHLDLDTSQQELIVAKIRDFCG